MRETRALRSLVWASLWLGCGGDSTGPTGIERIEIRLPRAITTLMVNDTAKGSIVAVEPTGAWYPIGLGTWRSTAPSIVEVDTTGFIRGLAPGLAVIVATVGTMSDSLTLTVAGTLHEQSVTTSEVWSVSGAPHRVRGRLSVGGPGGVTVTIEGGAAVLFEPGAGVTFGGDGSGALVADGTVSAPVILRGSGPTEAPGFWIGLTFRGPARSELRHVTLSGCGGVRGDNQPLGCVVVGHPYLGPDPALLIEDVAIRVGAGTAVILQGKSRFVAGSARLTVSDYDGPAVTLPAGALSNLPLGGSFTGTTSDTIRVTGDTIMESMTWPNAGVPWSIVGRVMVEGAQGPVLTIPAGQLLLFEYGAGFMIGKNGPGGLAIGSASGAPVNLLTTSEIGWAGISFWPGALPSTIRGAVLDNCGSASNTTYGDGCIYSIGNFYGTAPAPVLRDVSITRAVSTGIGLIGGGRLGPGSDNVVITETRGSPGVPVSVYESSPASIPAGRYTGNASDVIWISAGEVTTSETWYDRGVPYHFAGGFLVGHASSPVLSLEPGVIIRFGLATRLWVGALAPGALRAVGTETSPIVFTSQYQFAGSWVGVEIGPFATSTTLLEHVTVDFGGADDGLAAAGIRLARDHGQIVRNTLIRHSAGCGIARMGTGTWSTDFTAPELGNRFEENAGPAQCGP
jgi:hypothetical protein